MKKPHTLPTHTRGPVLGIASGLSILAVGIVLWLHAQGHGAHRVEESLAVGAALIGAFIAVCAARELGHQH